MKSTLVANKFAAAHCWCVICGRRDGCCWGASVGTGSHRVALVPADVDTSFGIVISVDAQELARAGAICELCNRALTGLMRGLRGGKTGYGDFEEDAPILKHTGAP